VSPDAETLFISDLHLDPDKPDIARYFVEFLKTRAVHARVLYILGDLFEIWLGDDDDAQRFEPALSRLRELAHRLPVFFIHGNRDFLLGPTFAHDLGITLLQEPHVITLGEQRAALMHGDLLCTDDIEYLKFRDKVRTRQWQDEFLAKDLVQRQSIARGLRQQSSEAMVNKPVEIMDVNAHTVGDYFTHLNVDVIIHGHTHRPGIHHEGNGCVRYVLGDWRPEASFLVWSNGRFELHDLRCRH